MDVQFNIWSIKVNGMENSSALNIGTNFLCGFGSNSKTMMGNGRINGDYGVLPSLFTAVDDRDLIDTPIGSPTQGGTPTSPQ